MYLLVNFFPLFFCFLDIPIIFAIFKLLKFTEPVSREESSVDDVTVREGFGGNRKDLCSPGTVC